MREDVFVKLEEVAKKIEREYGSLENFAIKSTMLEQRHIMKMREDFASFNFQEVRSVYDDLRELELADLLDFKEFVDKDYGEFG